MNYPSHIKAVDKDIKPGVKGSSRKDAEPSGVWHAYSFAHDAVEQKGEGQTETKPCGYCCLRLAEI
jgi:hypothetical protein